MAKGLLEKAINAVEKRDFRNTGAGLAAERPGQGKKSGSTLDSTKATAKSPAGVQKSKAQGAAEKAALRKKQQQRIAAAKKK